MSVTGSGTSGDKSQGAYLFSGNNANPGDFLGIDRSSALSAYGVAYVIPTEDEWYKAAYYTRTGYSSYANGQDTIPPADDGWNYGRGLYGSYSWYVGTGTMEQNGTFDMMGNIDEWTEGLIGDSSRVVRGGYYNHNNPLDLSSSSDLSYYAQYYEGPVGFRVVEVGLGPEAIPAPGAILLGSVGTCLVGWLRRRKML